MMSSFFTYTGAHQVRAKQSGCKITKKNPHTQAYAENFLSKHLCPELGLHHIFAAFLLHFCYAIATLTSGHTRGILAA